MIPGPHCLEPCHGHPHGLTALAPSNDVVSRLDHPARPRALLRFASQVTLCCAKIGFPGVDSSWDRTCSTHRVSHSPAFSCQFSPAHQTEHTLMCLILFLNHRLAPRAYHNPGLRGWVAALEGPATGTQACSKSSEGPGTS
jgi:hypothetical protein